MRQEYFRLGNLKVPRFSIEEQRELVRRAQAGDLSSRDDLVTSYIPAVMRSVRMRCSGKIDEYDDCVQEVMARLLRAVECFDLSLGLAVSTYFFHTIFRTIINFNRARKFGGSYERLVSMSLGMEHRNLAVTDDPATNLLDCDDRREVRDEAAAALQLVSAREREILLRYFSGESLRQLGGRFGLSKERIRQIKLNAIETIQDNFLHPAHPARRRRPSRRRRKPGNEAGRRKVAFRSPPNYKSRAR